MKNIFKKLLLFLLLTPLLFLTGCGALSSGGGNNPTQPVYKNYVSIDSTTNSVGVGDELEYEDEGINKKWGVALSSSPDHTAESVSEGLKTTTTFTANDIGVPGSFTVNFVYEKRSSTVATSKSETRSGSESTTYLGGSNTNYEGQFRILESDYRLGVHIPQQTNHGVVVAVLGSGIMAGHQAFSNSTFWQNSGESCGNGTDDDGNGYVDDCYGWDFGQNVDLQEAQVFNDTHETKVAGLISGQKIQKGFRGINPKAEVMNIKIMVPDTATLTQWAAQGTRYAADNINGKCIMNMSFNLIGDYDYAFRNALDHAYNSKGCLIIAGAGNNGYNSLMVPQLYSDYVYSITGLNFSEDGRYSESSWADSVTFAAPVYQLYSSSYTNDLYHFETGTSLSSPLISGLASLIWGNNPNLNKEEVLQKLINNADSLGDTETTGYGKINVKKLVETYVELHFKTVQADIDNDGQLEQLQIEISTKDGSFNKGYITNIIDDGVQYSVFRAF
jgi:hypothetical protein